MKRKVKVETERMVLTHAYLRQVSLQALEMAEQTEEGRLYNCMVAMLFSAFCIEAYLNHLGNQKLNYWSVLKRKLSPTEKLQVLTSEIGYDVDFGSRPFQTFGEIFNLRNQLVHAETEYLSQEDEQLLAPSETPAKPKAKWEMIMDLEVARRFVKDTKTMLFELHSKAGLEHDPFWTLGTSSWTVRAVE